MTDNQKEAERLKQEAVRILGLAGMAHVNAARVVDCIIEAALLEVAAAMTEAQRAK